MNNFNFIVEESFVTVRYHAFSPASTLLHIHCLSQDFSNTILLKFPTLDKTTTTIIITNMRHESSGGGLNRNEPKIYVFEYLVIRNDIIKRHGFVGVDVALWEKVGPWWLLLRSRKLTSGHCVSVYFLLFIWM